MIKKVLIAEDIDTINIGVANIMSDLGIPEITAVQFAQDALPKIKKALAEDAPFELLITDLSFVATRSENGPADGEELIAAVRQIQPNIKILVYSIEGRPHKIRSLFDKYKIDGFIMKGMESIPELQRAIHALENGEAIVPPAIFNNKQLLSITDYDIAILKLLAEGLTQDEIAVSFRAQSISPASKSSVEKHISMMRDHLRASNNVQIVAIAKDFGLI